MVFRVAQGQQYLKSQFAELLVIIARIHNNTSLVPQLHPSVLEAGNTVNEPKHQN